MDHMKMIKINIKLIKINKQRSYYLIDDLKPLTYLLLIVTNYLS